MSPAEANDYYRSADVVVMPYLDIGTSGVLRYAYSSGRAVLATAVGEHIRHVIPGVTGHLVPPGQPRVLADALAGDLADRAKLSRMGDAALRYAETEFDWASSAALLDAMFTSLASRGRSRRTPRPGG